MYGILEALTKENVLKKANSYAIFKYYCPTFEEFNKLFTSPLREDKHPSASIIFYKGDLLFKDFGEGSYRAIDFVSRRFNISFFEALQKINADLMLGLGLNSVKCVSNEYTMPVMPESAKVEKRTKIIQVKRREWHTRDREYWNGQYGILEETLKLFDVAPISHFTIDDYLYIADKYSYNYNYYWEDGVFRRKIYQPFSSFKWVSNGGKIVQGEGMLPKKGDLLIITSSLKDVMVLFELGYVAVAPTSEMSFVPEEYLKKQNARFQRIIAFMDSDDAGYQANLRWWNKYGIGYIMIPEEYKSKDISDFVKNNSVSDACNLMSKLISEL
jgi:hypothetical protein